ncbi:hypothetical protein BDF14DRAFT_1734281 [Spinellus fusiger]|nr:hypothetical protein BDF14DRAFT_1734281 [Spinellus fusiger]
MSFLHKELLRKHQPLSTVQETSTSSTSSTPSTAERQENREYNETAWSDYFEECLEVEIAHDEVFRVYVSARHAPGPVMVLHHGAGSSALSFALMAQHLHALTQGMCAIVAYDARSHGHTRTPTHAQDHTLACYSADMVQVIKALYKEQEPQVLLIGHR